ENRYAKACEIFQSFRSIYGLHRAFDYLAVCYGRRTVVQLRSLGVIGTDHQGPWHFRRTNRLYRDDCLRWGSSIEYLAGEPGRQDQGTPTNAADFHWTSSRNDSSGLR